MATTPTELEAPASNRNTALLAVLGLVVLLGLVWFFVLRSDPVETAAITPPATTTATPQPAPTAEEEASKGGKAPLETFEVFAPKDPFKPLLSEASGTAAAPSGTGTTTDGTTTGGTDTGGTGTPSGGSDVGSGSSGSGSKNVGGRRVRLIDTFRVNGEERANIQVDGTVYTVAEGDRFADNFQLVSISGSCASMLYGDDQFSLCEGEEILK